MELLVSMMTCPSIHSSNVSIIMGKGCMETIYGPMGWKGLSQFEQSNIDTYCFEKFVFVYI